MRIEITGVMPLPAANRVTGALPSRRQKTPLGGITHIASPACTVSSTAFETRPSTTRLIVTLGSASTPGALASE